MNEHIIVINNIRHFDNDSLQKYIVSEKEGINAYVGKMDGGSKLQSYLFSRDKWDIERAQKWIDDHGRGAENWLFGGNDIINLSDDEEEKTKMDTKVNKALICEVKDFNEADRSFTATASTSSVDRDGDILVAEGVRLKNFRKNPRVLWGHDANGLPIAKATDIKVDDGKITFRPKFVPAEISPFADQVFQMYKAGFLSAFSVRFDPIEVADRELGDDKSNIYRSNRVYKKWELLEISACNIPANPECLAEKGLQDFYAKSSIYEMASKISDKTKSEAILKTVGLDGAQENFDFQAHEIIEKQGKVDELKHKKSMLETNEKLDAEIKALEEECKSHENVVKLEKIVEKISTGITVLKNKSEEK